MHTFNVHLIQYVLCLTFYLLVEELSGFIFMIAENIDFFFDMLLYILSYTFDLTFKCQ